MMEIISPKSNKRKTFTKEEYRLTRTETQKVILHWFFFINTIVSCIFRLLYGILALLFYKFTVKLKKSSRRHSKNWHLKYCWYPPSPQFSLKTLRKHYLKLDLPDWYMFLCTFSRKFCLYIIYLQLTKIYPVVSNILSSTASIKPCKNIIQYFFTDLWSNTSFYSEKSPMHYVGQYLEAVIFFSLGLHVARQSLYY